MNPFLAVILSVLAGQWLINVIAVGLNLRKFSPDVPLPFADSIDRQEYAKSQHYMKARSKFHIISSSVILVVQVGIICGGGFNLADQWIRGWGMGGVGNGLFFGLAILIFYHVFHIPMDLYETFVIEEKFGFNKTTQKTFWADWFKGSALGGVLGGGLWFFVLLLFEKYGLSAWLYCWLGVSLFQIAVMYIAPVILLPIFYELKALPDGDLKNAIETYSRRQGFKTNGIFVMDGSRRSTRTNAFFTGFGRFRRIVFFDTLLTAHPKEEILAVLAHEMGHYKLKHVIKMTVFSLAVSGILFWGLTFFAHDQKLFWAFRMENVSTYAGIILYGYLGIPLLAAASVIENMLSRIYEFEADAYASATHSKESMAEALKRIAKDNLVNLTPHPFKVWLMDSHPPILERLKRIEDCQSTVSSMLNV